MTEENKPFIRYFENGSDEIEFDLTLDPWTFRLYIQEIHWNDGFPKEFFVSLIGECFSLSNDEEDQPVFKIDTERLKRIVSFVEECNEQKFKFASDIEDYIFKLFMFKKFPGSQYLLQEGPKYNKRYFLLPDGTTVDYDGHKFDLQYWIKWQEAHKDDPPSTTTQSLMRPGISSVFGNGKGIGNLFGK